MTKKLLFAIALITMPVFLFATGKKKIKDQIIPLLNSYQSAFNLDSFHIVESFLTENFKISAVPPGPASKSMLVGLLHKHSKGIENFSYKIKKMSVRNRDSVDVSTKVTIAKNKFIVEKFTFVNDGGIYKIDWVQGRMIDLLQEKSENGKMIVSTTISQAEYKTIFKKSPDSMATLQKNKVVNGDTINKVGNSGKPDGKWNRVYENGSFRCEGEYVYGKKEGFWRGNYENGKLMYECYYHEGKYHGSCQNYYENGNLKDDGIYKNGAPDGVVKSYYENGKPESSLQYSNGQLTCPCEYYDENGNPVNKSKKKKRHNR